MLRRYIKKSEPNVILTIDATQLYWIDRLKEPGSLAQFHEEHTELFDERYFSNIGGSRQVLILENDFEITEDIRKVAERVSGTTENPSDIKRSNRWVKLTSLNPSLLEYTYRSEYLPFLNAIHGRSPHNILIDSIFKDRQQFAWMVKNFLWNIRGSSKLTYFIISHGTLVDTLNEEYVDKKKYAYESLVEDGRYEELKDLNYLIRMVWMNRIYDIDGKYIHHIIFCGDKFKIGRTYLWDTSGCTKKVNTDVGKEKKSMWE